MPSSTQLHPTLQNMLCKHPEVNFGTIKVYVSAHLVAWQVIFSPKNAKWLFLGQKMHFLAWESFFYAKSKIFGYYHDWTTKRQFFVWIVMQSMLMGTKKRPVFGQKHLCGWFCLHVKVVKLAKLYGQISLALCQIASLCHAEWKGEQLPCLYKEQIILRTRRVPVGTNDQPYVLSNQ